MKRLQIVIMVVMVSFFAATSSAQSITTCDDFTHQEEAQSAWDRGEGRPRPGYLTGMDEDNDGIACEHLTGEPAFYQSIWFAAGVAGLVILGVVGFWWSRKGKAANATRNEPVLFPGRTPREEVEDELALLKADREILEE